MSAAWVVFKKEMRDAVRDRRSLLSSLLFPLIGPALVALMLQQVIRQQRDRSIDLPVVGKQHAPALVAFLADHDVEAVDAPARPLVAVERHDVELVLIVPEDYAGRMRAGRPAAVKLVLDGSRRSASRDARKVRALLQAYGSQIATQRLLAHGVDPTLVRPIDLDETDLATPRTRAAAILNVIPMFVLLAAFIGGLYVATDSTAGERERGSLEPLLITPVARRDLVLGKYLATVAFSSLTVLLTLAWCLVALQRVPLEGLALSLSLAPRDALRVLFAVVPLGFFAAGLQLLVATFARTVKEAQTYISLMIFFPMLPGVLLSLQPIDSELWMMAVPVFGQQVLLTDLMRGDSVPTVAFLLAGASALLVGLVCVQLTARLFRREAIVFGR